MVWCVLALAISAAAQPYNEALFKGMKWRDIGPYRGGRVLAVTGIPGSSFTYYFGGVAGGVWRTTDGGVSWQPISDQSAISSIGAVAVDERFHPLLGSVESADAAPTKQQYEVFDDLEKEAQPLLAQYRELMSKDLPALNEMVTKQNVPVFYVPAEK